MPSFLVQLQESIEQRSVTNADDKEKMKKMMREKAEAELRTIEELQAEHLPTVTAVNSPGLGRTQQPASPIKPMFLKPKKSN